MPKHYLSALFVLLLLAPIRPPLLAQDPDEDSDDDSSAQVEESDEAYRRRMELEDARQRDPLYTAPPSAPKVGQEKIDKLPAESRENIREQLVDVIIENGEWEPFDALREYPYTPTEAAESDPELLAREQEAWAEQIEKYNEREAQAYANTRGPPPGSSGQPGGQAQAGESQVGQPGSGEQEGEQQSGQSQTGQSMAAGQQGAESESGAAGSPGAYQPYQSNRAAGEEGTSTAGAEQSALDFLRGQGQAPPQTAAANTGQAQSAGMPAAVIQLGAAGQNDQQDSAPNSADETPQEASQETAADPAAEASEESSEAESATESSEAQAEQQDVELDLDTPGIIAIKDLDKLEGTELTEPEESGEQD